MSRVLSRARKRRGPHDIIADILRSAKKGVKRTKLVYDARLSFDQASRYLPALKDAGFVAENASLWKTTEKGLHVLEVCELCEGLLGKPPRTCNKP